MMTLSTRLSAVRSRRLPTLRRWCALAVLAAPACAEGRPVDGASAHVLDSAGVRVVHNPGTLPEVPAWTVREELTLEPGRGGEEGLVGRAVDAVQAPDGRILVLDQIGRDVKVFAPDGSFSHAVSRGGEGPGELGRPGSLWSILMASDTVLVPDPLQRRVSRFTVDGEHLGQDPMGHPFFGVRWERDPAGRLLVETSTPVRHEDGRTRRRVVVLRYDLFDSSVDTLLTTDPSWNHWGDENVLDYPLLVANLVWAPLAGGGLLRGATHRGRVDLLEPGGEVATRISHPAWSPRTVPSGVESRLRQRYATYRESLGPSQDPRRKAMHLGQEVAPTYAAAFEGPGGTIWVQRAKPVESLAGEELNQGRADRLGSATWDVFGPDGIHQGTVDFRAPVRVVDVRGGRVLGIRRSPLGEEVVVRLALEPR